MTSRELTCPLCKDRVTVATDGVSLECPSCGGSLRLRSKPPPEGGGLPKEPELPEEPTADSLSEFFHDELPPLSDEIAEDLDPLSDPDSMPLDDTYRLAPLPPDDGLAQRSQLAPMARFGNRNDDAVAKSQLSRPVLIGIGAAGSVIAIGAIIALVIWMGSGNSEDADGTSDTRFVLTSLPELANGGERAEPSESATDNPEDESKSDDSSVALGEPAGGVKDARQADATALFRIEEISPRETVRVVEGRTNTPTQRSTPLGRWTSTALPFVYDVLGARPRWKLALEEAVIQPVRYAPNLMIPLPEANIGGEQTPLRPTFSDQDGPFVVLLPDEKNGEVSIENGQGVFRRDGSVRPLPAMRVIDMRTGAIVGQFVSSIPFYRSPRALAPDGKTFCGPVLPPDGSLVVNEVGIWRQGGGASPARIAVTDTLRWIGFSSSNRLLVITGLKELELSVWSTDTGRMQAKIPLVGSAGQAQPESKSIWNAVAAVGHMGRLFAAGIEDRVLLVDLAAMRIIGSVPLKRNGDSLARLFGIAFSADDRTFHCVSSMAVSTWSSVDGRLRNRLPPMSNLGHLIQMPGKRQLLVSQVSHFRSLNQASAARFKTRVLDPGFGAYPSLRPTELPPVVRTGAAGTMVVLDVMPHSVREKLGPNARHDFVIRTLSPEEVQSVPRDDQPLSLPNGLVLVEHAPPSRPPDRNPWTNQSPVHLAGEPDVAMSRGHVVTACESDSWRVEMSEPLLHVTHKTDQSSYTFLPSHSVTEIHCLQMIGPDTVLVFGSDRCVAWNLADRRCLFAIERTAYLGPMIATKDASRGVFVSPSHLELIDLTNGRCLGQLPMPEGRLPECVGTSADGRYLFAVLGPSTLGIRRRPVENSRVYGKEGEAGAAIWDLTTGVGRAAVFTKSASIGLPNRFCSSDLLYNETFWIDFKYPELSGRLRNPLPGVPDRMPIRLEDRKLRVDVDAVDRQASERLAKIIAKRAVATGANLGPDDWVLRIRATVASSDKELVVSALERVKLPVVNYEWTLCDEHGQEVWRQSTRGHFAGDDSKYCVNVRNRPSMKSPMQEIVYTEFEFPPGDERQHMLQEILERASGIDVPLRLPTRFVRAGDRVEVTPSH